MKLLTLIVLTAGLAAAQTTPQQFTGIHYGSDVCTPYTPDGENNCGYVGSITTDPSASYAYLTDNTGIAFPCYQGTFECINPRAVPPTVNLSGNWSGSITWQNGMQLSGTVTIASGTCYATGGPVGPYTAIYTVNCAGVDTTGQAASKSIKYVSNKTGGRGGAFWQQLVPYYAYNQPSQWPQLTFYVPYPNPPAASANVGGGPDPGN